MVIQDKYIFRTIEEYHDLPPLKEFHLIIHQTNLHETILFCAKYLPNLHNLELSLDYLEVKIESDEEENEEEYN